MDFVDHIKTPKLDGVFYHDHQHDIVEGTLCITGHHLLLSARQESSQELWLLHKNIDCVEKKPFFVQNAVTGGLITLKCKDLRIISLEIRVATEFYNIYTSLEKLSNLNNVEQEYPFFYRPMYSILEDGFKMFKPELEYIKMVNCYGTNNTHGGFTTDLGCEWRITNVNKDFTVCPTYGATLIVPKLITDEQITMSASFRDGGRFPVLSYKHTNGATLLRSSQPLALQGIKRCRADETILNVVLGRSKKGFIVDTWGKGKSNTEIDQHYSQWKKVNRSIGNVSSPGSVLDSFSKLIEGILFLCNTFLPPNEKVSIHWISLDNTLNI